MPNTRPTIIDAAIAIAVGTTGAAAQAAQPPQGHRGGVHRAADADLGLRLHENDQAVPLVDDETAARRFERHHGRDLRRPRHLEDVRGSLPDPDDLERMSADPDDAAEGIDGAEQPIDGPLLDDRDRLTPAQLGRGKRAAGRYAAAENLHEAVIGAEHAQDPRVIPAVLEPLKDLGPDRRVMDFGEARDRFGILGEQFGPDAHLAWHRIGVHPRGGEIAEHAERRWSDDLERIDDLLAEPRDDGSHRHDRGDADHDAEHRERRAELVGAELIEGDAPALADRVELHLLLPEGFDRIEA